MSMIRKIFISLVTISLVLGAISCGGYSSSNDQGTSVLAFGYFAKTDGTVGQSGAYVLIAPDSPVGTLGADEDGAPIGFPGAEGHDVLTTMGIQNRLSSQFVRIVRIDCSYDVPGAAPGFTIPNDSWNSSFVISSSGISIADATPGGPAVPAGGDTTEGGVGYMQFEILSTDIISYINVNRNVLPKLPFRMNASCTAVGVTQAGDTIYTNSLQFPIIFLDSNLCCTGVTGEAVGINGGFETGTSNGGGINFDDGTTSLDNVGTGSSTTTGADTSSATTSGGTTTSSSTSSSSSSGATS